MNVRLSKEEVVSIKEIAKEVFGKDAEVIVFGSRVYPDKRGGDIDFVIKTCVSLEEFNNKRFEFIYRLWQRIGQQKIDVVYYNPDMEELPIHKKALAEGLKL